MTDKAHRCTWQQQRGGTTVECSDAGTWTYDAKAKTWRPSVPSDRSRRCWAHGPGDAAKAKPVGRGGRRKVQPNARLQRIAGLVLGTSLEVTKALMEVHDELSMLGYPSSSSRGANFLATDSDPVGGDASRIAELTAWREDLRDAITDLGDRVDALIRLVKRMRNVDWAHGVKLCAENQQGREGSIEWGDPTCTALPVARGLCAADYQRERRWRRDNGYDDLAEPAA